MSYQSVSITKTRDDEFFLLITEYGGWRGLLSSFWDLVPQVCCRRGWNRVPGLYRLFHGIDLMIWKWSDLEGNTIKVPIYEENYRSIEAKWNRLYG